MTSHEHLEDPRNARVKVWMNGRLVPRDEAVVSIFDSGFLMGDGVWEGLRVHGGRGEANCLSRAGDRAMGGNRGKGPQLLESYGIRAQHIQFFLI